MFMGVSTLLDYDVLAGIVSKMIVTIECLCPCGHRRSIVNIVNTVSRLSNVDALASIAIPARPSASNTNSMTHQ